MTLAHLVARPLWALSDWVLRLGERQAEEIRQNRRQHLLEELHRPRTLRKDDHYIIVQSNEHARVPVEMAQRPDLFAAAPGAEECVIDPVRRRGVGSAFGGGLLGALTGR